MARVSPIVGPSGIPIVDLFSAANQARQAYAKGSYGLHGCWGLSDLLRGPHGRYNTQPESLGLHPRSCSLHRLCYPAVGVKRDLR
jgi:hypothetical protein